MAAKRIDDLGDLTMQGIWEAHFEGEFVPEGAAHEVPVPLPRCPVRDIGGDDKD